MFGKIKQRNSYLIKFSYILFVLPGLIIYASVVVFPMLFTLYLSFMQWAGSGDPQFVGLEHYQRMFQDGVFLHGLRNNILIVLFSVFVQIPLGLGLAYIIYRKMVIASKFFEAMIFIPIVISAVIVAILWNQIFAPGGLYTELIRTLTNDPGYVVSIFENKTWAITPILVVIVWYYTGMYMVIFLANLKRIPEEQIEAAQIDGAKELDIFIRIILPQLVMVIFTCVIFAISGSLKSFDLIFAMTGGGPAHYTEVISIYMYINTFKYYQYGYGSAVSFVIILLSFGIIGILQLVYRRFEKKYL